MVRTDIIPRNNLNEVTGEMVSLICSRSHATPMAKDWVAQLCPNPMETENVFFMTMEKDVEKKKQHICYIPPFSC